DCQSACCDAATCK
ncbi:hypothetical protein E2320_006954, partial [Naja naja]